MVYDVYEVCGRAWPLDPEVDQLLGGMLTYIPPCPQPGLKCYQSGLQMHFELNTFDPVFGERI